MLTDRGFSLQTVGWVVSAYTSVGMVSTLVGGYMGDRVPIRVAIFGFSILQSVAVVVVVMAHSMPMVLLFALLLGAGEGRSSLTTAIRGVYFGRIAFASIMGMSMLPMNVLLFAAPLFAGYMFDTTGSYVIAFTTFAVVSGLGASLFLLLGDPKPLSASPRAALASG
jgi:MFS family permease